MRAVRVACLLACITAHDARAATVQVTVDGVRNARGHVLVALCIKAEFLQPHCPWRGHAAAMPGAVRIRIDGVPPGTYAAQAFHDENDNGKLDRSMLGLPLEAMGFSRDAPMHLGPPRFGESAFAVDGQGTSIRFSLHYY